MTDKIEKAFIVEIALLKAMANKSNYENYIEYVKIERLLPETQTLLEDYRRYYDTFSEHDRIDFTTFRSQFVTDWHAKDMMQDHIDKFVGAIKKIATAEEVDSEPALLGLINQQFIDQITYIGERPFSPEDIKKAFDTYEYKRASVLQEFDKDLINLSDLDLREADRSTGIPYAWPELQEALGGQTKGDLVIVNAGTDIGKTAFLYTQIVNTLQYLKDTNDPRPILFFNSEDSANKWLARLFSCIYRHKGIVYQDVVARQELFKKNYTEEYGWDRVKLYRCNQKGVGFVRAKVKKYNPAVVFIDMMKGLLPGGKSSDLTMLEETSQHLRDLSAETCPIWVTTQAGEGCKRWNQTEQKMEWKQKLEARDIRGDKDGIQGAASTIIGIGCHADPKTHMTRYINVSKSKTGEAAYFQTEIDFKTSSYSLSQIASYEDF